MSEWISVEDRLPENQSISDEGNDYVLIDPLGYSPTKAMYCGGEWYVNYIAKVFVPVFNWMPIPESPKND